VYSHLDQPFYRDTWAEINLDHIYENVQSLKNLIPEGVTLFAVVKANAYGHGDIQVAKTAIRAGATYLAVAFMDEAIALRRKGITEPILVLGASRPEDVRLAIEHNITLTVFQTEWLLKAKEYVKSAKPLRVHLKVDTGMGRIGVRTKEELQEVESLIEGENGFYFEGLFTHFSTADALDLEYYHQQLACFKEMVDSLKHRPDIIHCSNSAASLRFPKSYFNGVRMGISMYGLTPSIEMESEIPFQLKEAFSLHTKLIHVKELQTGDKVSYGATYEVDGNEWIGTLPIGYADGWIRKLGGQQVLVEGKRVPIVGRICMDQTMIKLPSHLLPGTLVTLIGNQGSNFISVNEIAHKLDTINYEVICMISNRVPRIYRQGGQVVETVNGLFM